MRLTKKQLRSAVCAVVAKVSCSECHEWPMYRCPQVDHEPCGCHCHNMERAVHSLLTKGCEVTPEIVATLRSTVWGISRPFTTDDVKRGQDIAKKHDLLGKKPN